MRVADAIRVADATVWPMRLAALVFQVQTAQLWSIRKQSMSRDSVAQQQVATTLNFIDGQFVAAASGKTFDNRSPVDGRLLGLVSEAGEAEVDSAVNAARAALAGPWGALDMTERTELLYAVANEISRRFDEFLEAEVADTGKPANLARHIDIPRGAANFKIFADVVKNVPGEFFQMATPDKK